MTNHRIIESTITPPELSTEESSFALGMAREKALSLTSDRKAILVGCAAEVEAYCGRLFWRGEGGDPRESTSVVEVVDPSRPVSVCPEFQNVSGVVVSISSVEIWDDVAAGWVAPSPAHVVRPAGRVLLHVPGEYRLIAELEPAGVPAEALEAAARLFAYREPVRPSDSASDLPSESQPRSNAIMRSGAADMLLALRRVSV